MKVCTCFLLFRIFVYTNSSPLNTPKEDNGGSSLALEVGLELNVEGNSQFFVGATNLTVINENKIPQPNFRALRVETFTDFIQGVAKILNNYKDTAFADFFDILDQEIRKYHYRGCKFYELTENYEFRNLLAEKLDLIKTKSVPLLKAEINEVADMIEHEKYNKTVKELLEYINSLYREDAREKFGKVLTNLKVYGNSKSERPKTDLVKIIRNGVRANIFDHYTDLNINVRRELKKEIGTFLKKIKDAPSSSSKTNLFPYKPVVTESENTVKNNEYNIAIEDEQPELFFKTDPTSTAENNNVFILKASDKKHQEEATKYENSKEESNSQELQITYLSTDESSDVTVEENSTELSLERQRKFYSQPYATLYTEDISHMNTEKPEIIYEPGLRSKLVQRMLVDESTDSLPTVQPTTTPRLRLMTDEDLRRSILPPMPNEELSIDIFDRDERKRQKSLAKSNRINNLEHGIKVYIKRMKNLQNKVKQLKKINEYNQNIRMNVNGYKIMKKQKQKTRKKKNKRAKDKKNKNKRKKSKKIKKTKHVSKREYYEDEATAETEKSKHKVRESKREVKKTNSVNEDIQGLESIKKIVKNNDRHGYKLKKQKKVSRSKTTKATKTGKKHKDTTYAVTSVNIQVRRSLNLLPTAKNNAGNTTDNDNHMTVTKTTLKVTKKVRNTTLNVTAEVKQKRINNTVNDDYVTKNNPTHRHKRVLEFSSPPLYDQPFGNYTFREELHPANIGLKKNNGVGSVTNTGPRTRYPRTANDNYVTKDNPTRRYRRVLEFSSPPLYDQPFGDYTFREGLHPASIGMKKNNGVDSVTNTGPRTRYPRTPNDNYVTKDNPTRRYRRVLEFSSPPLYDQPFGNYTFREGLHPANIGLKKDNGVGSVTNTGPRIA